MAFVVGGEVEPEALRAFLRDRLAAYKVPRRYVWIPELPLTGPGKVDRRALADRLREE